MPVELTDHAQHHALQLRAAEFAALRRTIAGRGTARMVIAPVSTAIWGSLAVTLVLLSDIPLAALVSLAVLVAGFEAVHALHVGAERVGRYLQVNYEGSADGPRWETAVMAVGPALPGGGIDPLFSVVFISAAILNVAVALPLAPIWQELAVLAVFHGAFIFRIVRARAAAARQRAVELESFKALLFRERDRS